MLCDILEKVCDELNEIWESFKFKQGGWVLFKVNCNVCCVVFFGMLLQVMQQFIGMNIIMYYVLCIFKMVGFIIMEQ